MAMTGEILARRYPAAISGADWTMSATDVVAVAISLALSKHVPGWCGAEDEELEAVARAVIEALERPHTTTTLVTG